jgi:hypothetical protein
MATRLLRKSPAQAGQTASDIVFFDALALHS